MELLQAKGSEGEFELVKLPKITVRLDEEEAFSFGKISPALVIGFGIHFTWMFLVQFSADHLFFEGAPAGTSSASHLLSLSIFVLTLFAYAALLRKCGNCSTRRTTATAIAW